MSTRRQHPLTASLASTGFASDMLEGILSRVRLTPANTERPDAETQPELPLTQIDGPPMAPDTPTTYYRLGECSVIVTHNRRRLWHLSIAHPERYPTWDEIAQARYRLLPPDIWCAMYLPPKSAYVNMHKNCFQLSEAEPPPEELQ